MFHACLEMRIYCWCVEFEYLGHEMVSVDPTSFPSWRLVWGVFVLSASWVRGGILYEEFSGIKFPFIFLLGGPKYSLMVGKSADGLCVLTTICSMWRIFLSESHRASVCVFITAGPL